MASKRPSDTAAIAARPLSGNSGDSYESCTVSTRRIENGYVTTTSKSTNGNYSCKEVYSQDKPALPTAAANPGREALSDAVKSIRR